MGTRVVADLTRCQGYANCLITAPEVFDLSDDGKVLVRDVDLALVDQATLAEAVASCPAAALTLLRDDEA